MDALSEVLSLLSTRSSYFAGLRAGRNWAIDFPPPEGIKFNAVVEGECWLTVDGVEESIHLQSGDCFLLTSPRRFSLASDLSLPAVPSDTIYQHAVGGIAHEGTADAFFLVGGRFSFGEEASLIFDGLPPVAVVKSDSDQASVLRWSLARLAHELTHSSPGSALVAEHLGHIMLVQVLRLFLAGDGNARPSLLLAMSDKRIGAALQAMHANVARAWTIEALAELAHMSRSTLALRFKQKAGVTPLEYLLHWRMHLAARSLKTSHLAVSTIGQQLGYTSDSAFSSAFKRVMKCSPKEYRLKNR